MIGRQLHVDVVARGPAEERITMAFEELSRMEALKRFRPYVNYVVLQDATKAPGTARKLIALSRRAAEGSSRPNTEDDEAFTPAAPRRNPAPRPEAPARPKPFAFEFDPAAGERGQ